eukprot:TRINITY_DN64980_c0_g1_i1.p1 TRINITY_DN64980_c0_g1~~TRINITY_DN64980_c0_g1_i1.p1  ORF type:complete len:1076 (-),score=179.18 TRINITY_DN64980_c0_g1_i1:62-3289(-)
MTLQLTPTPTPFLLICVCLLSSVFTPTIGADIQIATNKRGGHMTRYPLVGGVWNEEHHKPSRWSTQQTGTPPPKDCTAITDKAQCDDICFWDEKKAGGAGCVKDDCDQARVDEDANACMRTDTEAKRDKNQCQEATHGSIPCECLADFFFCVKKTHPACWAKKEKGQCCGQKGTCVTQLDAQCPQTECEDVCVGTPTIAPQATLSLICEFAIKGQSCPITCTAGYTPTNATCAIDANGKASWQTALCNDNCLEANNKLANGTTVKPCGEFGTCYHSKHTPSGITCVCNKNGAGEQTYGAKCDKTEKFCRKTGVTTGGAVCKIGGSCDEAKGECTCPQYYGGADCTTYTGNACLRHKCSGHGGCTVDTNNPMNTICSCDNTHDGPLCDQPNPCKAPPLEPGVTDKQKKCTDTAQCKWADGQCVEDPPKCNCKNGGRCLYDELQVVACACQVGFADIFCTARVGFEGPINVTHVTYTALEGRQECTDTLSAVHDKCKKFLPNGYFTSGLTPEQVTMLCEEDGCIDALHKAKDKIIQQCPKGTALKLLKYTLQCTRLNKDDPKSQSCFNDFHKYENETDFIPGLYIDHGLKVAPQAVRDHCTACNKDMLHEYSMLTSLIPKKDVPTEEEAADMESAYLVRMHEGICTEVNGEVCALKFFNMFYGESAALVSEYEAYRKDGWLKDACEDPCFSVGMAWWAGLQLYAPRRKREQAMQLFLDWDIELKYMCVSKEPGKYCMQEAAAALKLIDFYTIQCEDIEANKDNCCVGTLLDSIKERTGGKMDWRAKCGVTVADGCPLKPTSVTPAEHELEIPVVWSDAQELDAKLKEALASDIAQELGTAQMFVEIVALEEKKPPVPEKKTESAGETATTKDATHTTTETPKEGETKPTTTEGSKTDASAPEPATGHSSTAAETETPKSTTLVKFKLSGPTQAAVEGGGKVFKSKTANGSPLLLHDTALTLVDEKKSLLTHGVTIIPKPEPPTPPPVPPVISAPTPAPAPTAPEENVVWVGIIVGIMVLVGIGIGVFLFIRKKKMDKKAKELDADNQNPLDRSDMYKVDEEMEDGSYGDSYTWADGE